MICSLSTSYAGRFGLCGCVLVLAGALGCVDPQTRQKAIEETEQQKDMSVRVIGDLTDVSNVAPLRISGVGLVTGLNGTGGSPPEANNEFRRVLRTELYQLGHRDVEKLLASPDNAMVLVSAVIPPGARKGDELDVDVSLPVGSKATSLRGGRLEICLLRDYETTRDINPKALSNKLLFGNVLAKAHGPLLVGFGEKNEEGQLRHGRIWAGSICLADRPFALVLRNDERTLAASNALAQRINAMFEDDPVKRDNLIRHKRLLVLGDVQQNINQKFAAPTLGRGTMAKANSKNSLSINVPYAYRFNAQRYLRVVRLIPLQATPDKMERYRHRLEKMLLDPKETVRVALRLEALGKDSIPVLQRGLTSKEALVRFAAAEALSYLGSTTGCEQLARLAEQYPLLRSYSLLALAGLEESICREHLADMLASPDAELRCGAFEALRLVDETDRRLNGEKLNGSFWLHRVAASATPLVFFAVRQRAEIVLFGSDVRLLPGPSAKIMTGEFIIGADNGDDSAFVSRFEPHASAPSRQRCSLRVEDILRTLADMGGQYADAVGFLTKADEHRCLSCPVRCRTLPQEVSVEMLAQSGKDPELLGGP